MISRIEFGNVTSRFQNQLRDDIEKMKEVNEVIVSSDKTKNHYKLKKDKYNKLLVANVTCEYEKSTAEEVENVNRKSAEISRRLELEDRMEVYTESEAFLSIKDHKVDFPARIRCQLINPAKTDIGRVACRILQEVNSNIREKTGLCQWRSTKNALEWFKNIQDTSRAKFIKFDIEAFYPSAKEGTKICKRDNKYL